MDVADAESDQDLRDWGALVLCDMVERQGDVSASLGIYLQETVQPQPAEADLAAATARNAHTVVLYPAEEVLPSAYWFAAPDGTVTRARLEPSDDYVPVHSISARGLRPFPMRLIHPICRECPVCLMWSAPDPPSPFRICTW
ncbi:hypothetical protein [Streptomyces beihaiensis]|uniref:Uncharacterized protein n=1 Tax=Streptomyces beihaiensis TaxID=2984495 RepID=A0ABT3U631_9ACTN|nr:hypothetical protein [Streptomyces beihaiensis]MCX3063643.1 hypothetical protein [Streptomyces beihaiensis]